MLKIYENALERHILKMIEDDIRGEPQNLNETYSPNNYYSIIYNPISKLIIGFISMPFEFEDANSEDGECLYLGKIDAQSFERLKYADTSRLDAWPTWNEDSETIGLIKLDIQAKAGVVYNDMSDSYISSDGEFNFSIKIIDEYENLVNTNSDMYVKNMGKNVDMKFNDLTSSKIEIQQDSDLKIEIVDGDENNQVVRVKAFINGEQTTAPKGRWLVRYLSLSKDIIDVEQFEKLK